MKYHIVLHAQAPEDLILGEDDTVEDDEVEDDAVVDDEVEDAAPEDHADEDTCTDEDSDEEFDDEEFMHAASCPLWLDVYGSAEFKLRADRRGFASDYCLAQTQWSDEDIANWYYFSAEPMLGSMASNVEANASGEPSWLTNVQKSRAKVDSKSRAKGGACMSTSVYRCMYEYLGVSMHV